MTLSRSLILLVGWLFLALTGSAFSQSVNALAWDFGTTANTLNASTRHPTVTTNPVTLAVQGSNISFTARSNTGGNTGRFYDVGRWPTGSTPPAALTGTRNSLLPITTAPTMYASYTMGPTSSTSSIANATLQFRYQRSATAAPTRVQAALVWDDNGTFKRSFSAATTLSAGVSTTTWTTQNLALNASGSDALPTGTDIGSKSYLIEMHFYNCSATNNLIRVDDLVLLANTLGAGSPPPSIVTSGTLPNAEQNYAYVQQFTATGGSGAGYTWSLASGSLPPGLSLVGDKLIGVPTTLGTANFVIRVTDSLGGTITKAFTHTTSAAPTWPASGSTLAKWTFDADGTGAAPTCPAVISPTCVTEVTWGWDDVSVGGANHAEGMDNTSSWPIGPLPRLADATTRMRSFSKWDTSDSYSTTRNSLLHLSPVGATNRFAVYPAGNTGSIPDASKTTVGEPDALQFSITLDPYAQGSLSTFDFHALRWQRDLMNVDGTNGPRYARLYAYYTNDSGTVTRWTSSTLDISAIYKAALHQTAPGYEQFKPYKFDLSTLSTALDATTSKLLGRKIFFDLYFYHDVGADLSNTTNPPTILLDDVAVTGSVTCVPPPDYGDATGYASASAGLVAGTPKFGPTVDYEYTQPADDGADEDGIHVATEAVQGRTLIVNYDANTSATSYVNMWVDWNRDGDFADAGEQVLTNRAHSTRTSGTAKIPVPAGASPGTTWLRARISSASGAAATGSTTDGEVEDDPVTITDSVMISGVAWEDADNDGQREAGERLLPGIPVQVRLSATNDLHGVTATDASGAYQLRVPAGTYKVTFANPSPNYGFAWASANVGSDTTDSDPSDVGWGVYYGSTGDIVVTAGGADIANVDAGFVPQTDTVVHTALRPLASAGTPSTVSLPKFYMAGRRLVGGYYYVGGTVTEEIYFENKSGSTVTPNYTGLMTFQAAYPTSQNHGVATGLSNGALVLGTLAADDGSYAFDPAGGATAASALGDRLWQGMSASSAYEPWLNTMEGTAAGQTYTVSVTDNHTFAWNVAGAYAGRLDYETMVSVAITYRHAPIDYGDHYFSATSSASQTVSPDIRIGTAATDGEASDPSDVNASLDNTTGTNDEDLSMPDASPGITTTLSVPVTVNTAGLSGNTARVRVFVDWNNDGDVGDANETLAAQTVAASGSFDFNLTPPVATAMGAKYLRIRVTEGSTDPVFNGHTYLKGEVEDYAINVVTPSDYGDAAGYSNAWAIQSGATPKFGALLDHEMSPPADDNTSGADEDGVYIVTQAVRGRELYVNYDPNVSGTAYVNMWIDWNRDGDFADAGEQVVTNQSHNTRTAGRRKILVPETAVLGASMLRARISTASGALATGGTADGEVEDYPITLVDSIVISGVAFEDANNNGQRDGGERLLPGIHISYGSPNTVDETMTDSAGAYQLVVPAGGSYRLRAFNLSTYAFTFATPNTGAEATDSDFTSGAGAELNKAAYSDWIFTASGGADVAADIGFVPVPGRESYTRVTTRGAGNWSGSFTLPKYYNADADLGAIYAGDMIYYTHDLYLENKDAGAVSISQNGSVDSSFTIDGAAAGSGSTLAVIGAQNLSANDGVFAFNPAAGVTKALRWSGNGLSTYRRTEGLGPALLNTEGTAPGQTVVYGVSVTSTLGFTGATTFDSSLRTESQYGYAITYEPSTRDYGDYWGFPIVYQTASADILIGTAATDAESLNPYNGTATGDDTRKRDDEDLTMPAFPIGVATNVAIPVTIPDASKLSGNTARINVWVDWNGDDDVSDANESLTAQAIAATGSVTFALTPPTGVTAGTRNLRIRITEGSTDPAFSGTSTLKGEVEDYAITVSTSYTVSGVVFDDVNYGGGAGRSLVASSGAGINGARVELYRDNGGTYQFVSAATTSTVSSQAGSYSFPGLLPASYRVRVVNNSTNRVPSTRSGDGATVFGTQLFRTDASSGSAVAVTGEVGGRTPSATADAASVTVAGTAMPAGSLFWAPATVGSADISGVSFGFNFDTIVNTGNSGLGTLQQFMRNANALSHTGIAQAGQTAGEETSIFMIPGPGDALGRPADSNYNLDGQGAFRITMSGVWPNVASNMTIDGFTQAGAAPNTAAFPLPLNAVLKIELDGSGDPQSGGGAGPFSVVSSDPSGRVLFRGLVINNIRPASFQPAVDATNGGACPVFVRGCYIGTSPDGSIARPNHTAVKATGLVNLTVGGSLPAERNLISGSTRYGVHTEDGDGLVVKGNFIGTNAAGSGAVPNQLDGVFLYYVDACVIGGALPGEGNLISGNTRHGIRARGNKSAGGHVIKGNLIGRNASNTAGLGNGGSGIVVGDEYWCLNVVIGGVGAGEPNIIAHNGGAGVVLTYAGTMNGVIRGNAIFANSGLGIDLGADSATSTMAGDGVNANDSGDADGGPNARLNFPLITSALISGGSLTISGAAPAGATIDLYETDISLGTASAGANQFGKTQDYGEGQVLLGTFIEGSGSDNASGAASVPTDADGNNQTGMNAFSFTVPVPAGLSLGDIVTATATVAGTGTSEFSPGYAASAPVAVDFGDWSGAGASTTNASTFVNNNVRMGATVDGEASVTPNASADADDITDTDDEDGVTFATSLIAGASATINVGVFNNNTAGRYLQGWIDFNNDGTFNNTDVGSGGERIYNAAVPADAAVQTVPITFTVPAGASLGTQRGARFRLTDNAATTPTSSGAVGETEDYTVTITAVLSVGDLVWNDANANGIYDSATESGISGVTVALWSAGADNAFGGTGGNADTEVATTTTNASGGFTLTTGTPGRYYLRASIPPATPAPSPYSGTQVADNGVNNNNNGYFNTSTSINAITSNLFNLAFNTEPGSAGTGHVENTIDLGFRACQTVTLGPATLSDATVGSIYNGSLSPSSVNGYLVFSLASGSLPPGISIANGVFPKLTGTPTAQGTYNFTLQATDGVGCAYSKAYSLRVCPQITITPLEIPDLRVGVPVNLPFSATGGTAPYSFTGSFNIPGLTLSAGVLSGTPTQEMQLYGNITATDANGCAATRYYQIRVCAPLNDTTNDRFMVPEPWDVGVGGGLPVNTYGPASIGDVKVTWTTSVVDYADANPSDPWSSFDVTSASNGFDLSAANSPTGVAVNDAGYLTMIAPDDTSTCRVRFEFDQPMKKVVPVIGYAGVNPSHMQLTISINGKPFNLAEWDTSRLYSYTGQPKLFTIGGGGAPPGWVTYTGSELVHSMEITFEFLGENGVPYAGVTGEFVDFLLVGRRAAWPDNTHTGVGNLVFADANQNGVYDSGEGVNNVMVELYKQGSAAGVDKPLARRVTQDGGRFYFAGVAAGSYFLHVPASNFAALGPLQGHLSIVGAGGDDGVDDGADENGVDDPAPASNGISSAVFALSIDGEPTGTETGFMTADDAADDNNSDLTKDFGFMPPVLQANVMPDADIEVPSSFGAGQYLGAGSVDRYSAGGGYMGGVPSLNFDDVSNTTKGPGASTAVNGVATGGWTYSSTDGSVTYGPGYLIDSAHLARSGRNFYWLHDQTANPFGTGAAAGVVTIDLASLPTPLTVGQQYEVSVWASAYDPSGYSPLTWNAALQLHWLDGSGTAQPLLGGPTSIKTTYISQYQCGAGCIDWQQVKFTFTCVSGMSKLVLGTNPAATGAHPDAGVFIDDLALRSTAPVPVDFGDLAGAGFATATASTVASSNVRLGATVDAEASVTPNAAADADDTTNTGSADDEDGVTFATSLVPGASATINVSVFNNNVAGRRLQAWIDFNNDGVFNNTALGSGGERIYDAAAPASSSPQTVAINFTMPAIASVGTQRGARFRFSNASTTPTSMGATGETEDYAVSIVCPTITPAALAAATVGTAYTGSAAATGGTAPYAYAVTSGALPAWATLNAGTGAITGTPNNTTSATFTITATDANGCQGSRAYTLTPACPAITVTPGSALLSTTGTAYTQTASPSASGIIGTFSWTLGGTVPAGMTINSGTGRISTTAATPVGLYAITVTASSNSYPSCSGVWSGNFRVCPVISLAAIGVPTVGTAYTGNATASGGTAGYTYTVTSGALPAWATLNAGSGAITGLPNNTTSATFTIRAVDTNGCPGTQSYTLTPVCPAITVNPPSLGNGIVDFAYSQTMSATGGTTPHTFSVTSGTLPAGLSLAPSTGVISGTPTSGSAATFTITATDAYNCTGSRSYTVMPAATDFGDWNGAGAATATASSVKNVNIRIGAAVDAEASVSPNAAADADDTTNTGSADDEDGVTFATSLTTGASATINVSVFNNNTANRFLQGWIDFNNDGTFDNTDVTSGGERVYNAAVPANASAQTVAINFTVPAGASAGAQRGARFRFTDNAATTPTSSGAVGEIEDHVVTINPGLTIGNLVWNDANNNGVKDAIELGVSGALVQLYSTTDATIGNGDDTQVGANFTTGATGAYSFTDLPAGNYYVKVTPPSVAMLTSGTPATTDNNVDGNNDGSQPGGLGTALFSPVVNLAAGAESTTDGDASSNTNLTVDFGLFSGITVGNLVFNDVNNSGTYESATESGISGLTVELCDGTGASFLPAITTTTNASGNYSFTVYVAGTYRVKVTPNGAYPLASSSAGADNGTDSNNDGTQLGLAGAVSRSFAFTLGAAGEPGTAGTGNTENTIDFGFRACPTIVVDPEFPATPQVGTGYTESFVATGGTAPYTYSISAGSLPAWATLNPATGAVTGLPNNTTSATFTIRATDASGCSGARSHTLAASCPTITVSPGALADADAGSAYTQTAAFSATGLTGTYSWSASGVPGGMTFNSTTRTLTGTPTIAGSYNVVVTATDTTYPSCSGTATITFRVCPAISVSPASLSDANLGVPFSVSLSAAGGASPYVFTVVAGALPSWATLSSAGVLSGTPDNVTPASFTIAATDAVGCAGTRSFTLTTHGLSLGNLVWDDFDNDGNRDAGEPGLPTVRVQLFRPGTDGLVNTGDDTQVGADIFTDATGAYSFADLMPGDYFVRVTPPPGFPRTGGTPDTADNGQDNDNNGAQPGGLGTVLLSPKITLAPGAEPAGDGDGTNGDLTVDFGLHTGVQLGNLVWNDANNNGLLDGGESGLPGVTVHLLDAATSTQLAATTTNAGGGYAFTIFANGAYRVRVLPPASHAVPSSVVDNADNAEDNDNNGSQSGLPGTAVLSNVFTITAGSEPGTGGASNTESTIDIGLRQTVSVGNLVFKDVNNDGLYTAAADQVVPGVLVQLFPQGADPLVASPAATAVSDAGGHYLLSAGAGSYFVYVPASQFGSGAPLENTRPSIEPALGGIPAVDDDGDQNALTTAKPSAEGVRTPDFTLNLGGGLTAATGETGNDSASDDAFDLNADLTVDLGFFPMGAPGFPLAGRVTRALGTTTAGEPLEGVSIAVYEDADGDGELADGEMNALDSATTNTDGQYEFLLPPGDYIVMQEALPGATAVADSDGGDPSCTNVEMTTGACDGVDFVQALEAQTFAQWRDQNALGGDNGADQNPDGDLFANLLEYALGTPAGSGRAASRFRVERSATGAVDAVLVRPENGHEDVRYVLEGIADLAQSPAGWAALEITPVATSNNNGTETLRFRGLDSVVGSAGFVRARVVLDADQNGAPEAAATTPAHGWSRREFAAGTRQTLSMPLVKSEIFAGPVLSATSGSLTIADAGLDALMAHGAACYVEVLTGAKAGQRFEVDEAACTAATIALGSSGGETLAGARVAVRPHWTLRELLPPALFSAGTSAAQADRVLFFDCASNAYQVFWLLAGSAPRWVRDGDATLADAGSRIIRPAEGMMIHARHAAASLLLAGQVRAGSFALPLAAGSHLLGTGAAVALSPSSSGMGPASGFVAGSTTETSSRLRFWLGDETPGATGYGTWSLQTTGSGAQWRAEGSATDLSDEDALDPFRAVFLMTPEALPSWVLPAAWTE